MSTDSSYAAILQTISSNIVLYVDFTTLILGTIGSICNLITLITPQMRRSSSVFYLLCVSVSQLFAILICVGTRLAFNDFGNPLYNQSSMVCKLRNYLVVILPALTAYYMSLAMLDRCLSTSDNVRIRTWSQPKIAHRLAAGTLIGVFLLCIHVPILFDSYYNKCQTYPGSVYTYVYPGFNIIVVSLLPHILMFIFSLITISNVRRSRRRVAPTMMVSNAPNHRQKQRLESQLIKIIVIDVVVSSFFTSLRVGILSYSNITSTDLNKTITSRAVELFIGQIFTSLYFFNLATPFYTSTLSSKIFRKAFSERITVLCGHYGRQLIRRIRSQ